WDGDGTVRFDTGNGNTQQAGVNGRIERTIVTAPDRMAVAIVTTNPANPVRNIRVFYKPYEAYLLGHGLDPDRSEEHTSELQSRSPPRRSSDLWDGAGTVRFDTGNGNTQQAGVNGRIERTIVTAPDRMAVAIVTTNPANPVRNIRVFYKPYEAYLLGHGLDPD